MSTFRKKDLYLVSVGFLLSGVVQRLFKASSGFLLSRVGLWKRSPSVRNKLCNNHPCRCLNSRQDLDKLIYAQYSIENCCNGPRVPEFQEKNKFSERIGILAERYCPALRDFTGEGGETTVLEIGCLTGGVSFELARSFQAVYACDESKECINIAESIKKRGWIRCRLLCESEIYEVSTAIVDTSIDRDRVSFALLNFKDIYGKSKVFNRQSNFNCVLALCLTRLEDPGILLGRLVDLVAPDGICLVGSTFEWHEGITPRDKWLGGYMEENGTSVSNMHTVRAIMEKHFTLVHVEDIPFTIRESKRREIVTTYSVSVWKRQR